MAWISNENFEGLFHLFLSVSSLDFALFPPAPRTNITQGFVERLEKMHLPVPIRGRGEERGKKSPKPLHWGGDQRCRLHGPKYVLNQTNNTSSSSSPSLFVHWLFLPPKKNNCIWCHTIFNKTGNLSHCFQFNVTAISVAALPALRARPPSPPQAPWLPSTAAPAVDLSGPAGSAVHGDCF